MALRIVHVLPADRRRSIYLTGILFSGLGLALFLSIFVTLAAHLSDITALRSRGVSIAFRAVTGLLMSGVGFGAMALASHALAGAEHPIVEEPNDARRRSDRDRDLLRRVGEDDARLFEDPRHWPKLNLARRPVAPTASDGRENTTRAFDSTMALNEVAPNTTIVVKIRCRACRNLSAEEANYCEHCGHRL